MTIVGVAMVKDEAALECRRAAHAERQRLYRARHPERVVEQQRRWRKANPDKASAATRRWVLDNKERVAERQREYRSENRDAVRAYDREWAAKNRAKLSAKATRYQQDHPEKVRQAQARRRARKANAPVVDLTASDWRDLLHEHEHRCYYCGAAGVRLEQEHKTPLARGGAHSKDNIVPACGPCNRRKATRTAEEFLS